MKEKPFGRIPDRHIAVQRTFLQIERRLKMSSLWQTVSENVVFVLEFLALIVVMFLIAYVIEKASRKKTSEHRSVSLQPEKSS